MTKLNESQMFIFIFHAKLLGQQKQNLNTNAFKARWIEIYKPVDSKEFFFVAIV